MNTQQIQKDKLSSINWISELEDHAVVEKIKSLMSKDKENALSTEQKEAIDVALESIAKYETKSHDKVMEETKKKYPHLFQR